jgi:hypothetical protein
VRARRAAAALLALAVLAGPSASAAAAPLSVIEDDASLLRSGPAVREATLDDMAALGAGAVRIIVLQRDVPAVWAQLDAAVAGAQARGIRPLLTLVGRPDAPSIASYRSFAATAGARYPSVHLWSLWNEPNIQNWLRPQRTAPHRYRLLANAGAAALHATGHAKDTILIGETAPAHTGPDGPTSPLAFVRAVLRDGPIAGTGWAHHAYAQGGVGDPSRRGDKAQIWPANLGVLRAALRAGHRPLPVWITEGGFQTDPPDVVFGIPLTRQAAWMNATDAIVARQGARSLAQYLVRDEPKLSAFQSGVRFADGRPKPSYAAYRAPLWVERRSARQVAVWGLARPRGARLAELRWRPAGGRGAWRTLLRFPTGTRTLDRRVALRARGGSFLLRWRDAAGALHSSRVATEGR